MGKSSTPLSKGRVAGIVAASLLAAALAGTGALAFARARAEAAAAEETQREVEAAARMEEAHDRALQAAADERASLEPQAEKVTVTFKNGDATVATIEQTVGASWQFPANPTPASSYYFSGWYTQSGQGGMRYNALDKVTSSAPTTLYAQYGKEQYFYVLVDDTDGDGVKDHMTFTADQAATTGRTLGTDFYRGFTNYDYNFWSNRRPQWNQAKNPDRIRKVTFDASFKDVQPVSINGWFMDYQTDYRVFEKLTEFENFAYLNTSRCKSFCNSFRGLESLKTIDVSSLDTSAAEYMDRAFFSNTAVESINISGWRMNSVVALEYMFNDCPKLKTVNMAGATAPVVNNTQYMFGSCSSLTMVDLSGVNLSNVTEATNMFYNCQSLKTIITAEGANMSGANCTNTFYNNNALVGLSVDENGVRRTTTFAAKKDVGATFAKTRTATQEGYFTAADSNTSYGITYHYNADGLDLSNGVKCMKHDISGTYPTIASALWSRMGYHATGWNTAPDGSGTTYGFAQQLAADIGDTDLYLQWEANTYSVRFDANGGVGSPAPVADVAYATGQVTMPTTTDVTREGYALLGWALTPTATQKAYDSGATYGQLSAVHGDELTLYAVWAAEKYTVTFDGNTANGGTAFSQNVTETFDAKYAMPSSNPTPASGYYFSGWYTAPVGGQRISATSTVKITAPTTLYAQYIKNQTFYVLVDDTTGDGTKDLLTFTADAAATAGRTLNVDYFTGNTTKMYDLVGGQSDASKYADWNKPSTGLKITKVRFDQSFKTIQPRSISGWFGNRFNVGVKNFERLSSFENFEYLDTSKTESFACAFRDLPALATLDLSSMDTSAALDMNRAFYNESVSTSTLRSVNISGWKMDNVTTMASMFVNCAALTDLNMSGATASALTAVDHMFENCRSLQLIDLSGFDLSHVTTTNRAFSGCSKLKTILVAEGTDLTGVTDNERTYYGCTNLVGKYYNAAGGVSGQRAFTSSELGATYSKACTPANDGYLTPATRFNSYGVTYHMNAGGMDVSSTSTSLLHSIVGSYPTLANALWTREGYHALSWNTVAAPTAEQPGRTLAFGEKLPSDLEPAANGGIDLYLQWAPNTYSVQFDGNGGSCTATAMSDVPYEDARILPDETTVHRDGYTFKGWGLTPTATSKAYDGGQQVSKLSSIDRDTVTLYAVWEGPNAYKITFDANVDNGGATVTETEGFTKISDTQLIKDERYSENFVLPEDATAREGYKFSGWYTKPQDGVRVSVNMADFFTEPSTLYAQYIKETEFYAVMRDNDNNGVKDQLIFTTDLTAYPGETYFTASSTALYRGLEGELPPWNAQNYYVGYDGITANIKKVTFDPTFKDVQPYSIYGWFLNRHWTEDDLTRNRENFKDLMTFENFEYLDTSRTEIFEGSFRGLTAITSLDLTKLNTTAATTTSRMFLGCTNLKEANISGWNMLNNKSVSFMFNMCSKLETVNMSGVKAPAIKDMSYMFGFNQENQPRTDLGNSPRLKSLDLSGFDLSTVENAYNAFYGCTDLETILCADTTSALNNPNMMNVKPTVSKEGATGYWDLFNGCNKLVGKYYSPGAVKTTTRINLPTTMQDGFYLRASAKYAKARTLTEDGCFTPLTKYNSFDIVYHMNAEDGSDATQVSAAPISALGAGFAKVASGLWSNPGFKAESWNTKPDGSGTTYEFGQSFTATDEPPASGSIDLYLQWKPNTYILTLDANGGSGSVNSKEYGYNNSESHGFTDEITLPIWSKNGIYRDGYELLGWSLSKTKTTPDEGFEAGAKVSRLTKVDGDVVTLYAIWKIRDYKVTIDLNGAEGTWTPPTGFAPVAGSEGVYEKSNIDFATTASLASPSRAGYTFAGWKVTDAEGTAVKTTVAASGSPRELKMGSGDATVTATWKVTPPTATGGLTYNGEAQTVMGTAPGHTIVSVAPAGATTSTSGFGVYEDGDDAGKAYATDAGTYAITVALSDDAKATGATWDDGTTSDKVIEATIERLGIGSATIAVPDVTFTGFEQRPEPTVACTIGTTTYTLQKGVDYTLAWSNNVHAADAGAAAAPTVTVTATPTSNVAYGNTQGEQSATFSIEKRSLAEPGDGAQVTFAAIPDQTYTGSALEPAITVSLVTADGTYTLPAADYDSSWSSNVTVTDAAQATATATATGDFTGAATTTFKVVPADISRATVTLNSATGAYDFEGTPLAYPADVAIASATLDYNGDNVPDRLVEGTEFTATLATADGAPLSSIDAPGTYSVALTGTGNFTGVALAPVTVGPRHYDVTFDAGPGSFAGATSVTLDETYDSAWQLPAPAPTLAGLSFAGWWTKDGASAGDPYGEAAGADWGERVTADTKVWAVGDGATLHARWSRDSFAATFSADYGATLTGTQGILDGSGTAQVEYGRSVSAGIGVDAGTYTFLGWTYRIVEPDGSVRTGTAADYATVAVTGQATFTARLVETTFVAATATDGLVGVGADARATAPSASAESLATVEGQRVAYAPVDENYELSSVTVADLAAPGEQAHTATVVPGATSFDLGGKTYACSWATEGADAGTLTLGAPGDAKMSLTVSFSYAIKTTTFSVKAYKQNVALDDDASTYVEDPSMAYVSGEVEAGSTIDVTPAGTEGFTFAYAVVENPAFANTSTARHDGSTIVSLYYARNTYAWTATFADGSGATLAPAASGTAAYGATLGLKGTTPAPDAQVEAPTVAGFGPAAATPITIGTDEKSNVLAATYAEAAYGVTVDANGGTWSQAGFTRQTDGTYKRDADLAYRSTQTLAAPTRDGYAFAGWVASGASAAVSGDTLTQGTEASVVTASWTVAPPSSTTRTFDGTAQLVVAAGEGFELSIAPAAGSTGKADGASVAGDGALATHAGTYEVTAALHAADRLVTWSDGTTAPKVVTATVERATNSWTSAPACASVTYGTAPAPTATPRFPLEGATVTWDYAATAAGPFSADAPTEVGTYVARATVEATDDYAALSGLAPFAIGQLALTDANVDAIAEQGYTGSPLTPPVTVRDGSRVLANGTDYTVTYESNVDVGTDTAVAIVEGRGNYAGTVRKAFSIGRAAIPKPEAYALTYNGSAQVGVAVATGFTLEVTEAPAAATGYGVYWLDGTEIGSAYFTTAGTYTVVATPDANHRWDDGTTSPHTLTVTVSPFDISSGELAEVAPLTYTGEAQQPAPALLVDYTGDLVDDQVNEGRDYALSWASNTNAGDATVTATGTGNFTGSVSRTFRIEPVAVTLRAEVASGSSSSKTYDKVAGEPTFTVGIAGLTEDAATIARAALSPTVRRTDAAGNPTTSQSAGSYVMKVSHNADPNYDVSIENGAYDIYRRQLTVTPDDKSMVFGDALPTLTGSVSGTYASGDSAASIGLAYACSVDADSPAGTYAGALTATIADPNYELSTTPGTLAIQPRALTDAAVTATLDGSLEGSTYVYTFGGEPIRPVVTADIASPSVTRELTSAEGADFTAQLLDADGNPVDAIGAAGTYTVRLTGTNNFSGTRDLAVRADNARTTAAFDANGGTFASGSSTQGVAQTYSTTYAVPAPDPTRTYTKGGQTFTYTFAGWWTKNGTTDGDWGQRVTTSTTCELTADATLFAKWETDLEKKPYRVDHYVQELDATGAPAWPATPTATDNATGLPGDDATYVTRTIAGHTLDTSRTTYADATHPAQVDPLYVAEDGSTVVSLYYAIDSYSVTWQNDGATFATSTAYYGSTATAPAAMPTRAPGRDYSYTFARWADESGNDFDNPYLPVTGAITYHAEYTPTPRTYRVTIDANGGVLAPGQVAEKSLAFAATLDLPDPTCARGWAFDGWAVRRVGDEGEVGTLTPGSGTTTYTGGTADVKISAKWRIPIPVAASGLAYNASEQQVLAASDGVRLDSITAAVGSDNEGSRIDEYGNAVATHAGEYSVTVEISAAALGVDESLLSWADGSTAPHVVAATIARASNQVTGLGTEPASPVFGEDYAGVAGSSWGSDTISYAWGREGTRAGFGNTKPTAAGTWLVRASVPEGDDWEAAEATVAFQILPATLENAVVASAPATYNAFPQEPATTVTVGGRALVAGRDYVLEYYADEALTNRVEVSDMVAAGTYWVKAVGVGNYATQGEGEEPESFKAGAYQIMPAELTLSAQPLTSRPYDGTTDATAQLDRTALALSGAVAGEAPTLDAAAARAALDSPDVGKRTATVTGVALAAGNPANANYRIAAAEGGAQATAPATVTPALLSVSGITASPRAYDGTTAVEVMGTPQIASGVVAGEPVTIDATAALSARLVDPSAGTARTATVSGLALANDAAAANVNRNYAFAETTLPVDIARAQLTVASVPVVDKTYDGTTAADADSARAAFEGAVAGETPTLDASALTATFASPHAGTGVAATVTGLALDAADPTNANYELTGTTVSSTASILKATLTATYAPTTHGTFGEEMPADVAVTGFVGGESASTALGYAAPTVDTSAAVHAGTYQLVPTGGTADDYAFAYAEGTLVVDPNPNSWVISAGVNPTSLVFGDTYEPVGEARFQQAGEPSFEYSTVPTFSPTSTTTAKPTAAGHYYVRASVAATSDWAASRSVGEFDIAPATFEHATVTCETASYTGSAQKASVQVRIGQQDPLTEGDDYDVTCWLDEACTQPAPAGGPTDAGTYWVKATGRGNYAGSSAVGSYTIDPARLTITGGVSVAGRPYDATTSVDPQLVTVAEGGPTFTGAVAGETPTLDWAAVSATLDGAAAGTHEARVSGIALAAGNDANRNYEIAEDDAGTQLVVAGVEVARRELTLAGVTAVARDYDGTTAVELDLSQARLDGAVSGETPVPDFAAVTGALPDAAAGEGRAVAVTGARLADAAVNANYAIAADGSGTQATVSVTVRPKAVTVTCDAKSKTFGDADPELTGGVSGLVGTESLVGLAYGRDVGEHAGNHRIFATWGENPNYAVTLVESTLTIASADLSTGEVQPISDQTYTGTELQPVPTVTWVDSQGATHTLEHGVDFTLAYESNVNVGTAHVIVTGTGDYSAALSATFQIVPAAARIPSALVGLVFDGTSQLGVDFDDALCVAEGERATDAGEHVATVRLADPVNCVWEDPSVDPADAIEVTYAIAPADIAQAQIAPIADQVETGEPLEPALDVTALGLRLAAGVDYEATYESNVGVGTATVAIAGTGNWTGTAQATFQIVPDRPDAIPMFRLFNPYSGEHFYTSSPGEREFLSRVGWNYEGVGWWAPIEGGEPVYRLYNPYAGDHHYTPSAGERDALVAAGWSYEGVGWNSGGDVPVLRQYNPYATVGTHNFTTSEAENDALVRAGWHFEGVGWMAVMAG